MLNLSTATINCKTIYSLVKLLTKTIYRKKNSKQSGSQSLLCYNYKTNQFSTLSKCHRYQRFQNTCKVLQWKQFIFLPSLVKLWENWFWSFSPYSECELCSKLSFLTCFERNVMVKEFWNDTPTHTNVHQSPPTQDSWSSNKNWKKIGIVDCTISSFCYFVLTWPGLWSVPNFNKVGFEFVAWTNASYWLLAQC